MNKVARRTHEIIKMDDENNVYFTLLDSTCLTTQTVIYRKISTSNFTGRHPLKCLIHEDEARMDSLQKALFSLLYFSTGTTSRWKIQKPQEAYNQTDQQGRRKSSFLKITHSSSFFYTYYWIFHSTKLKLDTFILLGIVAMQFLLSYESIKILIESWYHQWNGNLWH